MPSQPDETWRSEFQTAAKDLAPHEARPFAALRVTGLLSQCPEKSMAPLKARGAILIKWATRDLNPEPSE